MKARFPFYGEVRGTRYVDNGRPATAIMFRGSYYEISRETPRFSFREYSLFFFFPDGKRYSRYLASQRASALAELSHKVKLSRGKTPKTVKL